MQVMGGVGNFAKALAMSVLGILVLVGCGSSKTTVGQAPAAKQEGGQTSGNQVNTPVDLSKVLVANSFYLEVTTNGAGNSSQPSNGNRSSIGPISVYSTLQANELTAGTSNTGAVTTDRYAYKSLVANVLLASLRDQEFKTQEPKRSLNFQAAGKVLSAKMQMDYANNSVEVVVQYLISNYVSEMKYVGTYNPFGETLLHPVADWSTRGWTSLEPRQNPELTASFKCLDSDGTCQTAIFARESVQTGSVKIILRNSVADLKAVLPQQVSGQGPGAGDSQSLVNVIMNTFVDAQRVKQKSEVVPALGQFDNKLISSRLQSFEVVNGRSGFSATLTTEKGDSLIVSGPLVNSLDSSPVRVSADISLRTERTCNSRNSSGYCNSSMNDVVEAAMIGNDSSGNITLDLSLSRLRSISATRFSSRATLVFSKQNLNLPR